MKEPSRQARSFVHFIKVWFTLMVVAMLLIGVSGGIKIKLEANRTDYPHQGEVVGYNDTDWRVDRNVPRKPLFAVGDSILYRDMKSGGLPQRHPGLEVSSVPGRTICNLPHYLWDWKTHPGKKRKVVIALGTNACVGWTYAKFRAAVNLLPRTTKVIFVTAWIDPAKHPPGTTTYKGDPRNAERYSNWMRTMDRTRSGACVADWEAFAKRYPQVTPDGVHPTSSVAGFRDYNRILDAKLRKGGCR